MKKAVKNILIAGAGSIGQRHLQCLKTLDAFNLFLCDPNRENLKSCREQFAPGGTFYDLETALRRSYDAAIVAVPNHLHAEAACAVMSRGIPVLLEKPIEISLDQAQRIVVAARTYRTVCQIGYCLRFHPVLLKIKGMLTSGQLGKIYSAQIFCGQYLPDWRPGGDYRLTYSAHRNQGGGVCLDISHEYDYSRWFFGEPVQVKALTGNLSDLEIDAEDFADCIMTTTSGAVVSIHMDYLARPARRKIHVNAEAGTLEYDFISGRLDHGDHHTGQSTQDS